jgi:hypothetical protein
MRPLTYSVPCVVMQDTTYSVVESSGLVEGMPRVAPLTVGRVVYLPDKDHLKRLANNRVVAWSEGVGTIAVNRNALAQR